jgi:predicted RNase H-like HicB family nuclease
MRYTVVLVPDEEDGGYVAYVPSLPGVVAQGETIPEALAMGEDAAHGYVDILAKDHQEVPTEGAGVVVGSIGVMMPPLASVP